MKRLLGLFLAEVTREIMGVGENIMTRNTTVSRRGFLQGMASVPALGLSGAALSSSHEGKASIYKTLKIGMVKVGGSLTEKFKVVKAAGFAGIELNAPGLSVEDTRRAIAEAALPVDGTVCTSHWNVRHSDPNPETRSQALEDLREAIRQTHAVGGHSVLLVPGHGKDGPEKEIWSRSIKNIEKAIPLAAQLGIYIAIENVWNHFLYDHQGDSNQTAAKLAKYVDEFNSPWVGMQFDIGNHWKYGNTGAWIRSLGSRIMKLDAKGFSRQRQEFTKIGEGDLNWSDVRKALAEIHFKGWCAAEVKGGDLERLREVSRNLDRALGL